MAKTKKFALGGMAPAKMTLAGPGPTQLGPNSGVKPMPIAAGQMPAKRPMGATSNVPAQVSRPASMPLKTAVGKPMTQAPNAGRMKKGGSVKSSASKRGDGIAQRGKTKGKMV